jgi:hypothetical protein
VNWKVFILLSKKRKKKFGEDGTIKNYIDLDGGTHYIQINSGTVTATGFSSPTIYVDGAAGSAISDTKWHFIVIATASSISASNVTLGKVGSNYFFRLTG